MRFPNPSTFHRSLGFQNKAAGRDNTEYAIQSLHFPPTPSKYSAVSSLSTPPGAKLPLSVAEDFQNAGRPELRSMTTPWQLAEVPHSLLVVELDVHSLDVVDVLVEL